MQTKQTATQATRAARIAAVQGALYNQFKQAKQAKYQTASLKARQAAYMLAVQQLAAEHGLPAPNTMSVRNGSKQTYAPSNKPGACATVHELAAQYHYDRKATISAAIAQGINANTASKQFADAKRIALASNQ